MSKKRGTKRHTSHKKAPKKRSHARARASRIVVVENPRPQPMAHKKRRRRRTRKHARKANPSHASHAAPRRRRRRHHGAVTHKRRHHRRRNPGSAIASLMMAVGAGALVGIVGNIAAKEVQTLIPATWPTQTVDALKIAGGVAAGAMLAKKHPALGAGVAVGLAAPSVINIVKPLLPTTLQGAYDAGVYAPPLIEAVARDVNRLGTRIDTIEAVHLGAVNYGD